MSTPQKAPPTTVPRKVMIRRMKNPRENVEIYAEVLPDGETEAREEDGSIATTSTAANAEGVRHQTPDYEFKKRGALEIVTKLKGPVEIKGIVTIQTRYAPHETSTMRSKYGRGTTPEDKKTGATSLGFHEFCHQSDYLNYLTTKALPAFGGKAGMTVHQFQQAVDAFDKAMAKYWVNMDEYSYQRTDEVGDKKSTVVGSGTP